MTVKELLAKCRTNEQRAQGLRLRLPTSLSRTHSQHDRHMLVWLPSKLDMCIEACQEVRRDYERQLASEQISETDNVYSSGDLANLDIEWETIETWLKGIEHSS